MWVRDSEHRDSAGLPRLGARGGKDERREAARDPSEAVPVAGELVDHLVEIVAVGGKRATPTFVTPKVRIARWNGLASSKDRTGIASFWPKPDRTQADIRNAVCKRSSAADTANPSSYPLYRVTMAT